MVSRTATLRLQLIDTVSGPSRNVATSLRGIDGALARMGKSGSPEVRRLVKQLEYLQKKAAAIGEFREARRGLKETSLELKAARSNVQKLEKALMSATRPTAKMQAELRTARNTLKMATAAFREQGTAVRATERALRSFGTAGRTAIGRSQQDIRNEIAKTIRKMRELDRESRKPKPQQNRGGGRSIVREMAIAAGGGYVADRTRSAAEKSFFYAVDFNQAAEYQAALGDFNPDERKKLNRQAEKIGGDTRFSNVDVVKAQTTILQGGIRDTDTIMDLTQKVTDYALAMGVTLEEGAETVRGSALSKRVNLSDANAVGKFVDNLVWMAKNGGMTDEDVRQFMKYGGASTTGAKLPDDVAATIGMILRRSGVRGDEAGVFSRSAASKLVAPTQKGRTALAAMGIDFNKFVKMPDMMSEKGIEIIMKERFGARLTKDMKDQVKELMENGEFTDPETGESMSVLSDAGEFVAQMSDILGPLFQDKKGKIAAADAKALAKALTDFHKFSAESVDSIGLFNAIMSSNPTLPQLNAYFTDKQGGRANMIAQQWTLFQQLLEKIRNTPEGIANTIGTKANQGLYGDWTKLTGTVETALTRVGQDWEFATRPLINKTNELVDDFLKLSDSTRRLIEAFIAGAAVFAGFAAFRAGAGLLGRFMGGGAGGGAAAAGGAAAGAAGKGLLGRLVAAAPWLAAAAGMLSLKGDSANNSYLNASPEERKRMRDEARATANRLNAEAAEKQRKAEVESNAKRAAATPLRDAMNSITVSWPFAAQQGMRDFLLALTSGGDQAEVEAARIGEQIKTELTVVANPDVNTGRLERALGIARQLAGVLRGDLNATGGASAPSDTPAYGGPRASGGPVKKGRTYLVGERGPEPFTPTQDGHITSNRDYRAAALGAGRSGGVVVHQTNNFHLSGKATKEDAEELVRILDRQLNRSSQVAFGNLKYGDA